MAKIILRWEDWNDSESGFRVYRSTAPLNLAELPEPLAVLPANTTSFTDTSIESGVTYYYRVASVFGTHLYMSEEVSGSATSNDVLWDNVMYLFPLAGASEIAATRTYAFSRGNALPSYTVNGKRLLDSFSSESGAVRRVSFLGGANKAHSPASSANFVPSAQAVFPGSGSFDVLSAEGATEVLELDSTPGESYSATNGAGQVSQYRDAPGLVLGLTDTFTSGTLEFSVLPRSHTPGLLMMTNCYGTAVVDDINQAAGTPGGVLSPKVLPYFTSPLSQHMTPTFVLSLDGAGRLRATVLPKVTPPGFGAEYWRQHSENICQTSPLADILSVNAIPLGQRSHIAIIFGQWNAAAGSLETAVYLNGVKEISVLNTALTEPRDTVYQIGLFGFTNRRKFIYQPFPGGVPPSMEAAGAYTYYSFGGTNYGRFDDGVHDAGTLVGFVPWAASLARFDGYVSNLRTTVGAERYPSGVTSPSSPFPTGP